MQGPSSAGYNGYNPHFQVDRVCNGSRSSMIMSTWSGVILSSCIFYGLIPLGLGTILLTFALCSIAMALGVISGQKETRN